MEFQQNSATTTVSGVAASSDTPKISSPAYRRNMTPDKRGSGSVHCRICHEDGGIEELIDPCECSGTLGLIHATCLERWLSTSNTDCCEICKYSFMVQKKHKPFSQSFRQWWRSRDIYGPQGIAGDLTCVIVLTPLCIAATYLCAIGASAYTRLGFWEGTGLAVLSCMLVVTYCTWLIVTIRFHFKSWQQWRRKNQDVKLMVKHKSVGLSGNQPEMKTIWAVDQDSNNNNNAVHNSRLKTWFFALFASNNSIQLYPLRQQANDCIISIV